jgi:hypothetical protein
MSIGIIISSTNYSGQTGDITFSPSTGGTISLGYQTLPYTYTSDYPYGIYDVYFSAYNTNCIVEYTQPTPTPTATTDVTPTPTPTPTATTDVTPTPTPTPTATTDIIPTPTPTPTATTDVTPTPTPTPTATTDVTPTPIPTNTPTPSPTSLVSLFLLEDNNQLLLEDGDNLELN